MGTWTSTPSSRPRADWYVDPGNPALLRYWDGQRWTGHTSPRPQGWGGQQWTTYAPSPGSRAAGAAERRRPRTGKWAVIALASFVGLATLTGVGAALSVNASEPGEAAGGLPAASSDVPAPASTPTPTPTPTPEPTPTKTEPPKSVVPRLTGLTREEAEELLIDAGLEVSEIQQVFSPRPAGTVLSQGKKVGASVLTGTEVVLTVAKAYPRVPDVVGRLESAAVSALRDAGFKVTVTKETRTSGKDGVVLQQTPSGSVRAEPHSSIALVVSSVVRTVAPTQNCAAGYDPCLTPASDYDCAGGSGDGPKYTGFVRVTGSDPYDLDADGDGVACET